MSSIEKARRLWRELREGAQPRGFARSVAQTILLRLAGVLLAFLSSMLMARMLGAHGYGVYAYVMATAAVLSLPAALGLPQYLVREGAGRMRGVSWLRRWADRRVMVAGALMASPLLLAAWLSQDAERRCLFALATLVPLLTALAEVRRSLLQANGLVVRSQLAASVFVPSGMLIGLAVLWWLNTQVEVWEVMALTVAVAMLPSLINGFQLRTVIAAVGDAGLTSRPTVSLRAAMRFMWLSTLYLLLSRADLIMLGLLSSSSNAGLYAVASRAADLVALLLVASNMVIAPMVAKLHRDDELQKLQELLTVTMRFVVCASLPLVLLLFFGAGWLLPLFYGDAYADGAVVLRILVVAQFVLVLGGPLGTTLEMTGNENACLMVIGWVVVLNVVLNALLIQSFGAAGAAVATCLSVIVGRVLLWQRVRRLVLLRSTAWGV